MQEALLPAAAPSAHLGFPACKDDASLDDWLPELWQLDGLAAEDDLDSCLDSCSPLLLAAPGPEHGALCAAPPSKLGPAGRLMTDTLSKPTARGLSLGGGSFGEQQLDTMCWQWEGCGWQQQQQQQAFMLAAADSHSPSASEGGGTITSVQLPSPRSVGTFSPPVASFPSRTGTPVSCADDAGAAAHSLRAASQPQAAASSQPQGPGSSSRAALSKSRPKGGVRKPVRAPAPRTAAAAAAAAHTASDAGGGSSSSPSAPLVQDLTARRERLRTAVSSLEQSNARLATALAQLRSDLHAMQAANEATRAANAEMKAQLHALQQHLAQRQAPPQTHHKAAAAWDEAAAWTCF